MSELSKIVKIVLEAAGGSISITTSEFENSLNRFMKEVKSANSKIDAFKKKPSAAIVKKLVAMSKLSEEDVMSALESADTFLDNGKPVSADNRGNLSVSFVVPVNDSVVVVWSVGAMMGMSKPSVARR